MSPALIAELMHVLGREKFTAHAAEGRAAAYIAALRDRAMMVEYAAPGPARTADADDDYLIALANSGAHWASFGCLGRRRERALGACPCEGLRETCSSRRGEVP